MDQPTLPARIPRVGSTYYFRRAVPPRLRPYFLTANGRPRTEFMVSLEVKDLAAAKDRWLVEASKVAALLREAEAKLKQGIKPDRAIAAAKPSEPWDPFPTLEDLERVEEEGRQSALDELEEEYALENDPIRRAREEGARAALAQKEAQDQAFLDMLREDQAAKRAPLMELFDAYVAERSPAPATVKRWRPVMDHLKGFLGHDDAARITRKDVVAWKDALLAEKGEDGEPLRKAKTVKETYLASLHVVLKYAADNARIKANVAADVTVRVPKKIRLRNPGFTDEEAGTILRATLEPQPESLSPSHRLARRWIPWLCAYTGARVGEMSQLRAQDVKQIEGVWTVRITPDAGGVKSGKFRIVPVHEHLIDQGFLDVVASKGEGPLFYNPERGRGGKDANPHHKKIGERLGAWVRKLGVDDPNVQPNHAWRHRFETEMRKAQLDYEARHVLIGHAHQTESGTYGEWDAPSLKRELDKLPRFETEKAVQAAA